MFVCVHKSYKEEYIPSVKLSGLYDFCFLFLMYFWNFFFSQCVYDQQS